MKIALMASAPQSKPSSSLDETALKKAWRMKNRIRPCNSDAVSTTRYCGALAALIMALLMNTGLSYATTAAGECAPNKTKYLASDTQTTTTSTSFVNVVGGALTFDQGGSTGGCVIVQFFGNTFVYKDGLVVEAVLDGHPGAPGTAEFGYADIAGVAGAHAMSFVFSNVTPGTHKIVMKMRGEYGSTVYMYGHTTLVMHQ